MANKMPPLGEPSRLKRRLIWLSVVLGIIVVAAVGAYAFIGLTGGDNNGDDQSDAQGNQATATPSESVGAEQALADFITTQLNQEYAGDCTASLVPETKGICSAARGERANRKAYLIGPSSYEYQLWVFLRKEGNGWKVETTLPVKPETVNAPGAPWPLEKGAKVIVGGTGTCLNVRVAPSIKEAAVDCIADGTVIILEDGPVTADGYEWWRPEGRSGWVAGDYLRYAEDNATPSPASATATPHS